ncbi:39252_t:CDS:1, partial [Gigaspora margarita]
TWVSRLGTIKPKLNKILKAEEKWNVLEKHVERCKISPFKNPAVPELLNSAREMINGREM